MCKGLDLGQQLTVKHFRHNFFFFRYRYFRTPGLRLQGKYIFIEDE